MKHWNYLQISLDPGNLDRMTGLLWELGTQGIEENPKAKRVSIKAYFDGTFNIHQLAKSLRAQCQKSRLTFHGLSSEVVHEQDWFKKWREELKPFAVGRHFYIFPSKDRTQPSPPRRFPIWLEPGMAFGTGTHETTQLCLEAMEDYLTPGGSFLDVGTGSGILALAAVKLGAASIVACDSDRVAIQTARANAAFNRCSSKLHLVLGEVQKVGSCLFDLIVANLTVEIVEESLPELAGRLHSCGTLILSGVLSRQWLRLRPHFKKTGLSLTDCRKKGEWVCLVLTKRKR
jgi:ribosomal protein L11 methyltransferase